MGSTLAILTILMSGVVIGIFTLLSPRVSQWANSKINEIQSR